MSLLGTGGAATLGAGPTEATIFDGSVDGGPVNAFRLKNNSGTITAQIRVVGMHISSGLAPLVPGEERVFVYGEGANNLEKITGFGDGGTLSLSGYVQKRA